MRVFRLRAVVLKDAINEGFAPPLWIAKSFVVGLPGGSGWSLRSRLRRLARRTRRSPFDRAGRLFLKSSPSRSGRQHSIGLEEPPDPNKSRSKRGHACLRSRAFLAFPASKGALKLLGRSFDAYQASGLVEEIWHLYKVLMSRIFGLPRMQQGFATFVDWC